jgi:hypothetical protein
LFITVCLVVAKFLVSLTVSVTPEATFAPTLKFPFFVSLSPTLSVCFSLILEAISKIVS